jgi:hypothetical protein
MIKVCRSAIVAVFVCIALSPDRAWAGPYGDEMSKCLVAATSDKDKTVLVRWLFAGVTVHPDVSDVSAVTPAQRTEIFKSAGALLERLFTESCPSQVRAALQNEGPDTVREGYIVLGRVAMERLTSDPEVTKGLGETLLYMNTAKLFELFQPK